MQNRLFLQMGGGQGLERGSLTPRTCNRILSHPRAVSHPPLPRAALSRDLLHAWCVGLVGSGIKGEYYCSPRLLLLPSQELMPHPWSNQGESLQAGRKCIGIQWVVPYPSKSLLGRRPQAVSKPHWKRQSLFGLEAADGSLFTKSPLKRHVWGERWPGGWAADGVEAKGRTGCWSIPK